MAIYHLRATMISRSAGRSATASAAYRCAARIADRRTGLEFDYSRRSGVEHAEILAPEHAPAWVYDRAELWNRVEEAETRKNSQVAREIRVVLPHELSHAERVELVRAFAREQFVARGMVADIALHAPGGAGDERNHHAHIMLSTREIGPEGFTAKNRDWNAVALLERWREGWAAESNRALGRAGALERVDHRTLEAQRDAALERAGAARARGDEAAELQETVKALALDREPLPQLTPGVWQRKARGQDSPAITAWREVKARAAEAAEIVRGLSASVGQWLGRNVERAADRGLEARLATAGAGPGEREPEGRSLADRLREAAKRLDPERVARRAQALTEDRVSREQEAAREKEQAAERERQKEREVEAERSRARVRSRDGYGRG